jgi:hypothetical protein
VKYYELSSHSSVGYETIHGGKGWSMRNCTLLLHTRKDTYLGCVRAKQVLIISLHGTKLKKQEVLGAAEVRAINKVSAFVCRKYY